MYYKTHDDASFAIFGKREIEEWGEGGEREREEVDRSFGEITIFFCFRRGRVIIKEGGFDLS